MPTQFRIHSFIYLFLLNCFYFGVGGYSLGHSFFLLRLVRYFYSLNIRACFGRRKKTCHVSKRTKIATVFSLLFLTLSCSDWLREQGRVQLRCPRCNHRRNSAFRDIGCWLATGANSQSNNTPAGFDSLCSNDVAVLVDVFHVGALNGVDPLRALKLDTTFLRASP